MPGLYIHIPFCRQACTYCDFHFTTSIRYIDQLCEAISLELIFRKTEAEPDGLQSIYFGGGTPSLLNADQLKSIFETINLYYKVDPDAEITLEANPDDLDQKKLQILRDCGINRLSIGVQSFREQDLRFMHRSHNADTALRCIELATDMGFTNFTIDLIYGIPGLSDQAWEANLRQAAELGINHLSCYSLTLESATPYAKMVRKKQVPSPDELQAATQMELLMELAPELGFEQYEISNFARNGAYAVHNTSYWKGASYIGIGPSAHSFNGSIRRQNLPNNQHYIRDLQTGDAPHLMEQPDDQSRYNETVLTGLRTIWGVRADQLDRHGANYPAYFIEKIAPWVNQGFAEKKDDAWVLNKKGMLLADRIAMDCFAG